MGPPPIPMEMVLVVVAFMLLVSVLASKASSRLGVPTLVVFIALGMAAGSEGLGGIRFDDARIARDVGTIALAFILFAGGLETEWRQVKHVLAPSLALATVGVLVTAGLVAAFAHLALGFGMREGLLLGAIVSSTDAAAVFGVLRAKAIRLRRRLGPMIELESGSNDPMAVFLTLGVTGLIVSDRSSFLPLIPSFFIQMSVGVASGYLLGRLAVWLINQLRLDHDGLYAAVTIGLVLLAYGGTHVLGGNGFLAVYVAGVTLASHPFVHRFSLTRFHDGIAWIMQIAMFVVLGLLAFPSQLRPVAMPGFALAFFLIIVARPIAVFLALAPFRMSVRERLFVGWVGLRGAVPIILATIPLTAGVARANEIFHLVFFAVIASVVIQGSTIGYAARLLRVISRHTNRPQGPSTRQANTIEIVVEEDSPAAHRRVVDMRLPNTAMILLLTRNGRSFVPQGATVLSPGDRVLLATRKDDIEDLRVVLAGPALSPLVEGSPS